MSLEMLSGVSVLFLFLAKVYNFDVVIKLIVILTHNIFSKIAIIVGKYVHTHIALSESGLHSNTEHSLL